MATVAAVHSQPPVVRTPAQVIDSLFQTDTPAERPSGQSLAASGYGQASPPARTRSSTTSRPRSPAHVLHPDGSREAEAFVRQRAERILCGMVSQVVKGLRQTVTNRRLTGQKAKTIHGVADYLYSNRERMRYDHYLANGWPIASGTVEGACKNLIRDRFERSGMRWTIETAEALLRLRAAHLSGDYDNYWEHHIAADQARLYRKDDWEVVLK